MNRIQNNYRVYEIEVQQNLSRFNQWVHQSSESYNQIFRYFVEFINQIHNDSAEVLRNSGDLQQKGIGEIIELLTKINSIEFHYQQLDVIKNKYEEIGDALKHEIRNYQISLTRITQLKHDLETLKMQPSRRGQYPLNVPMQSTITNHMFKNTHSQPSSSMEPAQSIEVTNHRPQTVSVGNRTPREVEGGKGSSRGKQEDTTEQQRETIIEILDGMVDKYELEQLEQWTSKTAHEIVFDSDHQQWSDRLNTFPSYVCNRKNLVFVIEDTNNNKFGAYIDAEIVSYGSTVDDLVTDQKAFVFTLKSNGRINNMMKFDIRNADNACIVFDEHSQALIKFGNDICVLRMENKEKCWVKQSAFDYRGMTSVLIGKRYPQNYFTPRRFVVLQMK